MSIRSLNNSKETIAQKHGRSGFALSFWKSISFSLAWLTVQIIHAQAAEVSVTPFHIGAGTNKPGWDEKTQRRVENCTVDFQAALSGKKPVFAVPHPSKEPTDTDQFYQGDGYQVHVTKAPVAIDGVNGFIYGAIIDLETDLARGEMHSILRADFYTADDMKKLPLPPVPFHFGASKGKPALGEKVQKRVAASTADFQAVTDGKKPIHAKPPTPEETHFFKGDGYHLDVIEAPIKIGGVDGFLYGPMLEWEEDSAVSGEMDSLFHVTFYTAEELKKLLTAGKSK